MDIYTDYGNWKFEQHEFLQKLISNESKTISRFTSVIAVVDYLYEQVVDHKSLSEDEEVIFSTGFDYIHDKFHIIKTILEFKFKNDYKELETYAKTINLLLYIQDFQDEALNQKDLPVKALKELDSLEDQVNTCLDEKKNAPEEYFGVLNDITNQLFESSGIEVHTVDQIFYEIALEYGIYHENEYDVFNTIFSKEIEKHKK